MLYMTTIESMSSILAYCSPNLKETYGTWNVKIIATSFFITAKPSKTNVNRIRDRHWAAPELNSDRPRDGAPLRLSARQNQAAAIPSQCKSNSMQFLKFTKFVKPQQFRHSDQLQSGTNEGRGDHLAIIDFCDNNSNVAKSQNLFFFTGPPLKITSFSR